MTDEEAPSAEIIELRPGQDRADDDRHMVREPRKYGQCRHKKIRLDEQQRRAYCRDCETEVPAFDYLWTLAFDWEQFIQGRQEAERRMKVARANLDELHRDERNAKSRRRNWAKHEPEAMRHLRAVMALVTAIRPPAHPVTVAAQAYLSGADAAGSEASEDAPDAPRR
jgi:hypothetical protein